MPSFSFLPILVLSLFIASCYSTTPSPSGPPDTTTTIKPSGIDTAKYALAQIMRDTSSFHAGVEMGSLKENSVQRVTGIAASRHYSGMFWACNDGGGLPNIFLMDSTGAVRATFAVTGAASRDWTDLAIGPGPDPAKVYLYVGDIGDGNEEYASVTVYRFPEPQTPLGSTPIFSQTEAADKINFVYPDGSRDAESLLLDPATKDLYVVTKDLGTNVYLAAYPQALGSLFTIKKLATLPAFNTATLRAGHISPDGSEILLKNLGQIFYWKREPGESVEHALLRAPMTEPYIPEAWGEAICWSATGDAYYTTTKFKTGQTPDFARYLRK